MAQYQHKNYFTNTTQILFHKYNKKYTNKQKEYTYTIKIIQQLKKYYTKNNANTIQLQQKTFYK